MVFTLMHGQRGFVVGKHTHLVTGTCHVLIRQVLSRLKSQLARPAVASAVHSGIWDTAGSMTSSASDGPQEGEPLIRAALRILNEPDAARKGLLTRKSADLWWAGKLPVLPSESSAPLPPAPECPARDDTVCHVAPLILQPLHAAVHGCAGPCVVHAHGLPSPVSAQPSGMHAGADGRSQEDAAAGEGRHAGKPPGNRAQPVQH